MFEGITGVFRIRQSKQDRQHNDQQKMDKRRNNDLQDITHSTEDGTTRTSLKWGCAQMLRKGNQFLLH